MSRLVDISPYEKCRIVLHKDDSGFPVKDLPTVDAVEVVRCKDCKYFDEHWTYCDTAHWCHKLKIPMIKTDFCSYGERKEAGE